MRHLYYHINNIEVRRTKTNMKVDGKARPTGYTYDLNSNITALNRRGYNPSYVAELIDDLVYQYDGNRVKKITEKAPVVISEKTMNFIDGADEDVEYTYDRNGNMTGDANKGLEMSRDYNNRLSKVEDDEMTMSFIRTGSYVGFSGSGGISTISSIELNWVLRRSQASILPIITVSQSIGAALSPGASASCGTSNTFILYDFAK